MHIARRIGVGLGDLSGECLDQGYREIAGPCRGLSQRREIKRTGLASIRDRGRRACRNDAGRGFRTRQRGFKIEHVLEIGRIIADGPHGGARQHGCEQRREGGAHDARDLTIPVRSCQSPSISASLLRCEYASPVA